MITGRIYAVMACSVFLATSANATVLTFEDLGIPNNVYGGDGSGVINELGYSFSATADVVDISLSSPYASRGPAHSGRYALLNNYGGDIVMTKTGGGTFDLGSFWFKSWEGTSLGFVEAYRDSTQVGVIYPVKGASWVKAESNFSNVDTVVFRMGNFFLLDDLDDGVSGAVPEPATWGMMIGGFALAGAAMRRRKLVVRFA